MTSDSYFRETKDLQPGKKKKEKYAARFLVHRQEEKLRDSNNIIYCCVA